MGEKFLTPLNVWEELIYSYFLSLVNIIMLRFPKTIIWECSLFIIRPVMMFNLLPVIWLTWLIKSPTIFPQEGWANRPSNNRQ